jgi:multiple sugar transport system permease protein
LGGLRYGALTFIAVITIVPFISMLLLAFTPPGGLRLPSLIPTELTLDNFRRALSSGSLVQWAINSMIYAVVSVVFSLFLASLAGYAFAKKRFAGREVLFWSFIAMLMIPGQLTIVPQYLLGAHPPDVGQRPSGLSHAPVHHGAPGRADPCGQA